jgi:hypothetical protein
MNDRVHPWRIDLAAFAKLLKRKAARLPVVTGASVCCEAIDAGIAVPDISRASRGEKGK